MTTRASHLSFETYKTSVEWGLLIVKIGISMLFATIMLAYVLFRNSSLSWPPMGMESVGAIYPLISTIVLLMSDLTLYLGTEKYDTRDFFKAKKLFLLSLLFAFMFIASQCHLWWQMKIMGLTTSAGVFPSIIYAFTWIHMGHILIALFGPILLLKLSLIKDKAERNKIVIAKSLGKLWHFVGIIWYIIYFAVFLY